MTYTRIICNHCGAGVTFGRNILELQEVKVTCQCGDIIVEIKDGFADIAGLLQINAGDPPPEEISS